MKLLEVYSESCQTSKMELFFQKTNRLRGGSHMTSIFRGWGLRQKRDVIGRREWGVSECSGRPIFNFFIRENWICAMARHHAVSNINILLIRNHPIDFGVRQWSHPLMIPLHCLCAKLNNRMRSLFECDAWLGFGFFWFVYMHGTVVVP